MSFKKICIFLGLGLVLLSTFNFLPKSVYAIDTGLTLPVTVQLKTSDGKSIQNARVRYQISSWKDIGYTDANGKVLFEVPAGTHGVTVRIYYEGTYFDIKQDVSSNQIFTFQTVKTQVRLKDSQGNPIPNGFVRFCKSSWYDFGYTDASGTVAKELLPNTYTFRMKYEQGLQDIKQNIAQNNQVEFQTIYTQVKLITNNDIGLSDGNVTFIRSSWIDFGKTDSNGVAKREVLPGTYTFRMKYGQGLQDIKQDITQNTVVLFQTIETVVKVINQNNLPVSGASIIHARSSWIDFGITDSTGQSIRQVLPGIYSIRVRYNSTNYNQQFDNEKQNPLVFQIQADDPVPTESYTLLTSVFPVNSGSVSAVPSKTEYQKDEWVTVIPVPASEYEFVNWSGPNALDIVDGKIRMDSNKAIRADFKPVTPPDPNVVLVSTSAELMATVYSTRPGNITVLIEDGEYELTSQLYITGNNVTFKSRSQDPDKVIIKGKGMQGGVTHVFEVVGDDFTAQDLTLGWVKYHGVQIHGESGADRFTLRNIHFKDTGEQMVKVSYNNSVSELCEDGLIENCTFEYTAGVGPQYYIAGVDAHQVSNLVIQDNVFNHITSPDSGLSEGAIHIWTNSRDTLVQRNVIKDCDRGIMFGLDNNFHYGGLIINNTIQATRDVGIYLANAVGTQVYNNTVFIDSSYVNAIEYRFEPTDAIIKNNITNKPITARNDAHALIENNVTNAMESWFVDPHNGDLHLAAPVYSIIDKGLDLSMIIDDVDQEPRQMGTIDIGADELVGMVIKPVVNVSVFPDKTTIYADGMDQVTLPVLATYADGSSAVVTPDRFICFDDLNNPIDIFGNSFSTYKAGQYRISAVIQDVQSDFTTISVIEKDFSDSQISDLNVIHKDGQTFVTFQEIVSLIPSADITYESFFNIMDNYSRDITYNIYRSEYPIQNVTGLTPIGKVGLLSCWNKEFYGLYRSRYKYYQAMRYVIEDGKTPLPKDTGLFVHNPDNAGLFYYAVTVSVDGVENTRISDDNRLSVPVAETIGKGLPVLQRIELPDIFDWEKNPKLYFYTLWESPPNCSVEGKPYDYLVAIPENLANPAPVGIHMHCWGGNITEGYAWWNNAKKGAILLASNQYPYDWWTGYHESIYTDTPPVTQADWQAGVVHPYSQNRLFSFLNWLDQKSGWAIDLTRTFTAGSSMGGSGSLMMAIRYPNLIAWSRSWVGVHDPNNSPNFTSSYANVYGKQAYNVLFEDGTPVWDYFNDIWYLKKYPQKEIGFLTFANGKNDNAIGWPQAVDFVKALQQTRRPFLFIWGQSGHSQRTVMPLNNDERTMPIDIRTDQTLPAFTYCSLDDDMGNGDPGSGLAQGQINKYLYWETEDIVDSPLSWEMTVGLINAAPQDTCSVDITPRRCQNFKPSPGQVLTWQNIDSVSGVVLKSGQITVDDNGLFTIDQTTVVKGKNRIIISQ